MVANGGVAVEIMSLAHPFNIVIFTAGFGGRPIGVRSSVNVGQCREHNTQVRLHGYKNMGAVEIASS